MKRLSLVLIAAVHAILPAEETTRLVAIDNVCA